MRGDSPPSSLHVACSNSTRRSSSSTASPAFVLVSFLLLRLLLLLNPPWILLLLLRKSLEPWLQESLRVTDVEDRIPCHAPAPAPAPATPGPPCLSLSSSFIRCPTGGLIDLCTANAAIGSRSNVTGCEATKGARCFGPVCAPRWHGGVELNCVEAVNNAIHDFFMT